MSEVNCPKKITLNGALVEYYPRYSNRAKRIQLAIRNQKIELIIPTKFSHKKAEEFLFASKKWLIKQTAAIQAMKNIFWPEVFLTGEFLMIEGQRVTLVIEYGDKETVTFQHNKLFVTLSQKTLVEQLSEATKRVVMGFLKVLAKQRAQEYMRLICQNLGRWPRKITVKKQSTRWGSCGVHEDIHINWLLILAPPYVKKYVVLHECCHLFYKNHGVRFWRLVEKHMPNYHLAEEWLVQNGRHLTMP